MRIGSRKGGCEAELRERVEDDAAARSYHEEPDAHRSLPARLERRRCELRG